MSKHARVIVGAGTIMAGNVVHVQIQELFLERLQVEILMLKLVMALV